MLHTNVNSYSMKNTTVQPSQMNGGNLANVFNLQSLRTVKGRVELNTDTPPTSMPIFTPINFVSNIGSPTILGPGNFILSDTEINGVKSINTFNSGYYVISIILPQILNSSNNQINIVSVYTQKLVPNRSGGEGISPNYIIFCDKNGQFFNGCQYTPGDLLTITFTPTSINYIINGLNFNQTYDGESFNLYFTFQLLGISTGASYIFNNITTGYYSDNFSLYQVLDVYNNPVAFGSNDFILGYSIINGNINNSGEVGNPFPLTPIQNSPIVQFLINPLPPIFEGLSNSWIPQYTTIGATITYITQTLTTGQVNSNGPYINSGFGEFSSNSRTSCGLDSWLQMSQRGNAFTIEGRSLTAGAINITLIILTL